MAGVEDFADPVDQHGNIISTPTTPSAPSVAPGVTPDIGTFAEPYNPPKERMPHKPQGVGFTPSKNPSWLGGLLEDIQKIPASPGGPPAIPSMMNALKGVPIAGRFAPTTQAMTNLEENNPAQSELQKITGGTLATAPVFNAVSDATKGLGLLTETLGQGATGAGLGAGDVLAEKGKDTTSEDLQSAAERGGFFSSLGPALAKFLSPGYKSSQLAAGREAPGSTPSGMATKPLSEVASDLVPPSAAVGPQSKQFNDLLRYHLEQADPLGEAEQGIEEMPFELPKMFSRDQAKQVAQRAHQMAREGTLDSAMEANREATLSSQEAAKARSVEDVTKTLGGETVSKDWFHDVWLRHALLAAAGATFGYEMGGSGLESAGLGAASALAPHLASRYMHNTAFQDMGPMLNAGLYNILGRNKDASSNK